MRKIRKQPRDEVSVNELVEISERVDDQSYRTEPQKKEPSQNSIVAIMKLGVTANELKLLEAIESESRETGERVPPMSSTYICSKYSINQKYLWDAIKGLIEKGLIKRHPAKFRGQKSFAWEIIQQ